MNGSRKPDKTGLSEKRRNKFAGVLVKAEAVGKRDLAEENLVQQNNFRTHRPPINVMSPSFFMCSL